MTLLEKYRHLLICLALAACSVAAFWPLQDADFINYDDNLYVFENRQLAQGLTLETLRWAFTDYHTGYWHPLTWLSLILDHHLFGGQPGGYHWTNLLFHILNSLLLYGILARITSSPFRGAVVAFLFALHPLHVESVAWISERKDVLSAFFFFLAMGAYAAYVEKKSWRAYLAMVMLFLCGLLSKPSVVTFPCVLLLLDYWPLRRLAPGRERRWLTLMDKMPLFLFSAVVSLMTFKMAKAMGGVVTLAEIPFALRLQNALLSYGLYLKKTFYPVDLAVFYPFPLSISWLQLVPYVLILVGLTCFSLCWFRSRPYVFVGWFWYLGVLFPVSGLFQAGEQGMADRYTYIALIGVFVLLVWGLKELAERWRLSRSVLVLCVVLVLGFLSALTRVQAGYWRDSVTLFEHAVQVTTDNYMAHNTLGLSLAERGRWDEALRHYREALALSPGYANAHNNMGLVLMEKGQTEEAIAHYREALQQVPNYPAAHINLGIALAKQRRFGEAMRHMNAAIAIDRFNPRAYNNLGIVLARQGDREGAIRQFRLSLALNPNDAEVHNNLGIALAERRDFRGAVGHFLVSLRLKPDDASVHNNLGLCLANAGYPQRARESFLTALRLKPYYEEARKNLEALGALSSSK